MLSLAALCASIGMSIAVAVVSLTGGYILAVAVFDRFSKTVLGTHVRHFFSRIAPAKRFDLNDRRYIERIIREGVEAGRINLKKVNPK